MPQYQCHKMVWALKIAIVNLIPPNDPPGTGSEGYETAILDFDGGIFAPLSVDADYVRKHKPVAGGYYVVYEDGYKSFSPAHAFEEGYALLSGGSVRRQLQSIGWAIKQLHNGSKVRRSGWNGKGMWLALIPCGEWGLGSGIPFDDGSIDAPRKLPWIGMRTADSSFVPWLASQTDILATDWEIAE